MDHRDRSDPGVGLRLVSSFTGRINAALVIVVAIDVAVIVLLLETLRAAPDSEPILAPAVVPMVLLAASAARAGNALVPRRPGTHGPAEDVEDASVRLRSSSQRFVHRLSALKGAGLLMICALVWRFIAIRLK